MGSRACDRRRARDERCFHGRCCAPASLGSGRARRRCCLPVGIFSFCQLAEFGTFNVELSTKSRRSLVVAPRRRPTCSRQHPSSYRAMPTRPRTTPTAIRSSIPRTTATRRLFYKVSSFLRGERFSPKSCRSSTSSTLSASSCSREAAARASRSLTFRTPSGRLDDTFRIIDFVGSVERLKWAYNHGFPLTRRIWKDEDFVINGMRFCMRRRDSSSLMNADSLCTST